MNKRNSENAGKFQIRPLMGYFFGFQRLVLSPMIPHADLRQEE